MSFVRERLPDPLSYFEAQSLQLKGAPNAKWRTTECRFHGGSDSMRIHVGSGAWVCMSCQEKGGDVLAYHMEANRLSFIDAAKDLGAWDTHGRPMPSTKPTPFPPRAALEVLGEEVNLVAIFAGNLLNGVPLSAPDRDRLFVAARRIIHLAGVYK